MIVWMVSILVICQDDAVRDWVKVTSDNAQASVSMPGEPVASSRVMSPVPGQSIEVHVFAFQDDRETNFVFGFHDQVDAPADNREINRILDGGMRGAVARTLGELESAEAVRIARYPGRRFTFSCVRGETAEEAQPMMCAGQLVLVEKRLYQLLYIARQDRFDAQEAEQFFKSFQLDAAPRRPNRGRQPVDD